MSDRPVLLHRPHSNLWWTKKRNYVWYVLRELSSVFVALAALGTIWLVRAAQAGDVAWRVALETFAHPVVVAFTLFALAFALLHTFTFFVAAKKAIVVHVGGRKVPGDAVVWGHVVAWVLGSALVAWAVLG